MCDSRRDFIPGKNPAKIPVKTPARILFLARIQIPVGIVATGIVIRCLDSYYRQESRYKPRREKSFPMRMQMAHGIV